jgi:hypothetical protein
VKFEIGFEVERDTFTTEGPTPRVAGWIGWGSSSSTRMRRPGFALVLGLRPLRIAWNGIWVYRRRGGGAVS